jgi:hypothetical protein
VPTQVRTERPLVLHTAATAPAHRSYINREREKKCRDIFKYYDSNADYLIDRTQMIYVLQVCALRAPLHP